MFLPGAKTPSRAIALPARQTGFTLIELLITIGLVAALTAVVVTSTAAITGFNLRKLASRMAGTIRYTYDIAARKGSTFRVVLDLDGQAFWIETADEEFLLDKEQDRVVDGAVSQRDKKESSPRRFASRQSIESGEMWEPKGQTNFSEFSGKHIAKFMLPEELGIKDVWVSHQSEKVSSGMAYIYCFPTGMTEEAVIHLVDLESDGEDVFTLITEPLTGRVKVVADDVEGPRR